MEVNNENPINVSTSIKIGEHLDSLQDDYTTYINTNNLGLDKLIHWMENATSPFVLEM